MTDEPTTGEAERQPTTNMLAGLDDLPNDCCARCRFFIKPADPNPGVCRRFPPTPFIARAIWNEDQTRVVSNVQLTAFPIVPLAGWCGEFRQRLNG